MAIAQWSTVFVPMCQFNLWLFSSEQHLFKNFDKYARLCFLSITQCINVTEASDRSQISLAASQ